MTARRIGIARKMATAAGTHKRVCNEKRISTVAPKSPVHDPHSDTPPLTTTRPSAQTGFSPKSKTPAFWVYRGVWSFSPSGLRAVSRTVESHTNPTPKTRIDHHQLMIFHCPTCRYHCLIFQHRHLCRDDDFPFCARRSLPELTSPTNARRT